MSHNIKGRKFSRSKDERKALLSGLACSLVTHEQMITTLAKAKDIRPYVEKLVTLCKENTLSSRRQALSTLNNNNPVVNKLLDILGPRYKERPGGYLRIIKAGYRQGDSAPLAIIEFVDRNVEAKGQQVAASSSRPALM